MNEFIDVQSKVSTQWGKVHQEADGSGSSAKQQGSGRRHWVSSLGCTELAGTIMHTGRQTLNSKGNTNSAGEQLPWTNSLKIKSVCCQTCGHRVYIKPGVLSHPIATEPESPGRIWKSICLTKTSSDFCVPENLESIEQRPHYSSLFQLDYLDLQTVVEKGGRCE